MVESAAFDMGLEKSAELGQLIRAAAPEKALEAARVHLRGQAVPEPALVPRVQAIRLANGPIAPLERQEVAQDAFAQREERGLEAGNVFDPDRNRWWVFSIAHISA